jgi:hypothetical protein
MTKNAIDSFLSHKTSEGGGAFLKKWRKKDEITKLNTWIHTDQPPIALWQHEFPRLFVKDDKNTGESITLVWGGKYKCREDESVLRKQYHRNDDGSRKTPPQRCPFCRLIEVVRQLVETKQLDWSKVLFRFEGDKDIRVVHAGGIYNAFKDEWETLDPKEKKRLLDAGITMKKEGGVWQENGIAKCAYVFSIVVNDNPSAGCQITTETSLLGDKVREVINDTIESLGAEDGNPLIKPYCIQWESRPNEQEWNKKYKARRMEAIPLTPEIEALIRGPAPDLKTALRGFNLKTMRAYMEQHCLIALPWDDIFNVPDDEPEEEEEFPPAEESSPKLSSGSKATTSEKEFEEEGEEGCSKCGTNPGTECPHVACDQCAHPILPTDAKCEKCGHVYRAEPLPPVAARGRRKVKETGDVIP